MTIAIDSPFGAAATPARITETWAELAEARSTLDHRLAADLLPTLVGALKRLTAPSGPYRARLVDGLQRSTGWTPGAIEEGLARSTSRARYGPLGAVNRFSAPTSVGRRSAARR